MIVAIDGPAGAGKSTVARRLAAQLGFRYLDTGAMYRALTWLALERGLALDDATGLAALAERHPVTFDRAGDVVIDGTVVTDAIREPRIDQAVSRVSRHPDVRRVMRARQRELADEGDAVIEGRDIGTVVAPDAAVKVYLVADERERARRRHAERPGGVGADAHADELRRRDENDAAQMQRADDAQVIDTTELDIDAVVARIADLVRAREPKPA